MELFAGPDQSPGIAAVGNDEIKKITDEHPKAMRVIAGIPFNNVAASIMEIKGKDIGQRVQIYAHMNGEAIDQRNSGLFMKYETLDLPILIHPVGGQKVPEFPAEMRQSMNFGF